MRKRRRRRASRAHRTDLDARRAEGIHKHRRYTYFVIAPRDGPAKSLRSHLARFCRGAHSVDPRDSSLAEVIGGLERVAARFAVNAAPESFIKVADVVARCAVRVGTNGSEGDLEGLARALRALAFDSKTARVYDAVVHVLPDAAKVLGAVAKL